METAHSNLDPPHPRTETDGPSPAAKTPHRTTRRDAQHGDDTLELDAVLVTGLRARDEAAFVTLLGRYGESLERWARLYLSDAETIDDVVQETWISVLTGIHAFQGRSSLGTWMFRILLNRIRTRQRRDRRQIPFSRFAMPAGTAERAVDPERFLPSDHPRWAGHWLQPPPSWGDSPEELLISRETRAQIEVAVAALPPTQREVITLRDIEGWSSEEVCNTLGITASNQRVLLHRARSRVRKAIESLLNEREA
jgi:RNA polymerase sigma-70 factor (ECF subfamily)